MVVILFLTSRINKSHPTGVEHLWYAVLQSNPFSQLTVTPQELEQAILGLLYYASLRADV